jgi:hypothetical protein
MGTMISLHIPALWLLRRQHWLIAPLIPHLTMRANNGGEGSTGSSQIKSPQSPHSYIPSHMLQHEVPGSFVVASDRTSSTRLALGLPTPLLIKLPFPEGGLNNGIP